VRHLDVDPCWSGSGGQPISDAAAAYSNTSSRLSDDFALTIPIDRTALWYHLLDFNMAVLTVFFFLLAGTLNFSAPTSVTLLLDIAFTLGSDCSNIPNDRGSSYAQPPWKTRGTKVACGINADGPSMSARSHARHSRRAVARHCLQFLQNCSEVWDTKDQI
jgi:hypothetical protein